MFPQLDQAVEWRGEIMYALRTHTFQETTRQRFAERGLARTVGDSSPAVQLPSIAHFAGWSHLD